MPSVMLSGPNNSTMFTTCCETAILETQRCCPRCKKPVYPYSDFNSGADYTNQQVHRMRWQWAFGPHRAAARRGGWW